MSIFEDIKQGLNEAIEYEKGNIKACKTVLQIADVDSFSASEIREIRKKTGLTQLCFAKYMGVSVKTVEAWESGKNHPEGSSCRLLTLTRSNPDFPRTSGIITS